MTLVLACYLLATLLIAGRLVNVQVVSADTYRELAEQQMEREVELPATRGRIYDRDGQPLAMSLSAATIYANPQVLRDHDLDATEVAAELAPLLSKPFDEVAALLEKDAPFVFLARQLPREVGEQITAMDLPGVGVLDEPKRTYPAGRLAAEVIGFAGVDNTGLSGLERAQDERLAGEPGTLRLERAPGGVTISAAPRTVKSAKPGSDLVLTLDRHIQHAAEQTLEEALSAHGAKGGSAVVMEVGTGQVLAMASAPGYRPTEIGSTPPHRRANQAVTTLYEPGSVSKVVTIAAALEEGVVQPEERFTVANGYTSGGQRFRRSTHHEQDRLDVGEVLAASSNVGTIQIAERLGAERLHDYLTRFGYAERTGLEFPGEPAGLLPDVEDWSGTSLPTIAIGQGVATNLLQITLAFDTIANDGEATQPTLVRGSVGPDGTLDPDEPPRTRRVVSPETASAMRDMLTEVVEADYGTGHAAAVPGYRVAGKTGTAQKASTDARGYEPGKYMASFIGFAPADDPELVVGVVLDEPSPETLASRTAAPVFAEIMGSALDHRGVKPDEPPVRAADSSAAANVTATEPGA